MVIRFVPAMYSKPYTEYACARERLHIRRSGRCWEKGFLTHNIWQCGSNMSKRGNWPSHCRAETKRRSVSRLRFKAAMSHVHGISHTARHFSGHDAILTSFRGFPMLWTGRSCAERRVVVGILFMESLHGGIGGLGASHPVKVEGLKCTPALRNGDVVRRPTGHRVHPRNNDGARGELRDQLGSDESRAVPSEKEVDSGGASQVDLQEVVVDDLGDRRSSAGGRSHSCPCREHELCVELDSNTLGATLHRHRHKPFGVAAAKVEESVSGSERAVFDDNARMLCRRHTPNDRSQ